MRVPRARRGRHVPRLRLRGGRRELGQPLVDRRAASPASSWTPTAAAAGTLIGLRIDGGKAIANGASGRRSRSPARRARRSPTSRSTGTSTSTRNPPLADTRPLYALYLLGGVRRSSAPATTTPPTRNRLKSPTPGTAIRRGTRTFSRRTTSLRQFGALAGYKGDATTLSIQRRLLPARRTNCSAPAGGRVFHVLYGIDVTVNDPAAAGARPCRRRGCWRAARATARTRRAPRHRQRRHPARRARTTSLRGRRSSSAPRTTPAGADRAAGATCSASLAKPCPEFARETVRPTVASGRPAPAARAHDRRRRQRRRPRARSRSTSPRLRTAARSTASARPRRRTLTARFRGGKRQVTHRRLRRGRCASRAGCATRSGQPVGGAEIDLVTTNKRRGATPFKRKSCPHGGRRHLHGQDGGHAPRGSCGSRGRRTSTTPTTRPATTLTLRHAGGGFARAVHAPPARSAAADAARAPAGARARGHGHPPGPPGRRRALHDVRRHRPPGKSGRFRVTYRFQDASSRGRVFRFRAKLRAGKRYPFATGYSRRVTVRVR